MFAKHHKTLQNTTLTIQMKQHLYMEIWNCFVIVTLFIANEVASSCTLHGNEEIKKQLNAAEVLHPP